MSYKSHHCTNVVTATCIPIKTHTKKLSYNEKIQGKNTNIDMKCVITGLINVFYLSTG